MTREELEAHVGRLCKELERVRSDCNLFQIERDKINTYWMITKGELETRSGELRAAQEKTEKVAERREMDLAAYRLRVRQIEASHANLLAEAKAEMEVAVGLAAQEARAGCRRPRLMEEALRKEAADHNELVRQLTVDHETKQTKLRQDFEQQVEAERKLYMEKMRKLEERLDLQRRTELQATEESKNEQIERLMRNHENAFMDMKNYYHSVTANNIDLIDNLKAQLEEKQKLENRTVKENGELATRNRALEVELSKFEKECNSLKKSAENHARDVIALKNAKTELKELKKTLSDTKVDNEALLQRLKIVESERNELYDRFSLAVEEIKQSYGAKKLLLEKRMAILGEELERAKTAKLAEADSIIKEEMTGPSEIEKIISSKDGQIKDLNYEVARVCKAYNDLLHAFKGILESYGISADSLGFDIATNVLINGGKLQLGKGPAGLITVPPV
ncbi:hypothetical protein Aperf_G00000125280 [Anoplocephala perfoliata]